MLQILPFLAWGAALTSAALLISFWSFGELTRRALAVLLGWFAAAAYCQFFGSSLVMGAVGLVLQTLLAVYLLARHRLDQLT